MTRNSDLIKRLINGLDSASGLWREKAALLAPGELSCRSGCFGCCIGLFAISVGEALALRAAVADLAEETRTGVLARAVRAVERSAASFPGDAAAGILDPDRDPTAEDSWLAAVRGIPCPALELPGGRCEVYGARPTTCRTYGLALAGDGEILLPACELNLPSAPPARTLEAALDAGRLTRVDQALAEIAASEGLPAGAETTVAHALTGAAFAVLERRKG
jgi:Fe-S-cluster containining protein